MQKLALYLYVNVESASFKTLILHKAIVHVSTKLYSQLWMRTYKKHRIKEW